jgi:uncharacterized protein YgbK (DUF1537 family)
MQSRLPCLTLNAAQLPAALATAGEEKRVLIVDAWEDSHLDQVIDAVAPHARETLLVGSAGSARRWPPPAPQRAGAAAGGGRFDE